REPTHQQLQWIAGSADLKTVFISHRNNLGNVTPPADQAMYEASLRKTLQLLTERRKKVVYLLAVAEARTNPRLCVGSTPMGRTIDRSQCSFPASRELKAHEVYRALVARVMKDFPMVEVVDPIPWQCPGGQCTVSTETQVLWSDDNHLSESGSHVQGRALAAHFSDPSRLPPPSKP
ncbi:MAG: SGNH hydrolase domain-containing protein, partial [Rhizobacter sp.]